jgi:hypothetical protein
MTNCVSLLRCCTSLARFDILLAKLRQKRCTAFAAQHVRLRTPAYAGGVSAYIRLPAATLKAKRSGGGVVGGVISHLRLPPAI